MDDFQRYQLAWMLENDMSLGDLLDLIALDLDPVQAHPFKDGLYLREAMTWAMEHGYRTPPELTRGAPSEREITGVLERLDSLRIETDMGTLIAKRYEDPDLDLDAYRGIKVALAREGETRTVSATEVASIGDGEITKLMTYTDAADEVLPVITVVETHVSPDTERRQGARHGRR